MSQKFEYKVERIESDYARIESALSSLINREAKDDWEFHATAEMFGNQLLIFKRASIEYAQYNGKLAEYLTETK